MNQTITRAFVVEMDSRVLEPADLWENYLEPRYRSRAIRIRAAADRTEELIVDNEVLNAWAAGEPRRRRTAGR